jgi:hypothetical protein
MVGDQVKETLEPLLLREAGAIAADIAPDGEPVDLVLVVPGERGLYFLGSVTPFYTRGLGAKIKGFFEAGRGPANL